MICFYFCLFISKIDFQLYDLLEAPRIIYRRVHKSQSGDGWIDIAVGFSLISWIYRCSTLCFFSLCIIFLLDSPYDDFSKKKKKDK